MIKKELYIGNYINPFRKKNYNKYKALFYDNVGNNILFIDTYKHKFKDYDEIINSFELILERIYKYLSKKKNLVIEFVDDVGESNVYLYENFNDYDIKLLSQSYKKLKEKLTMYKNENGNDNILVHNIGYEDFINLKVGV